ncbi:aspartate kinase [candidate division TA06 bacterium]|uniref:Aspartokinase n=1 Tax=candidate division TA06 bacterium TaxID=2250710 RepID=A0A523UUD9_UNCT6|nr:MAG: aspartate kinase [candidate division TA06 bacterium]
MGLIVQKYGGTSLASPAKIKSVAKRIVDRREKGDSVIVVVSAMGRDTDRLYGLARRISKSPPTRELDMLLTAGERISMALLAMAVHDLGYEAISFTGSQVGIITDSRHTDAKILEIKGDRIVEGLRQDKVVIVAGFQGVSKEKEVTTLGRGGSDTTAVAIAASLGADLCEIFTDVEGVFAADPAVVAGAKLLEEVSYDEMIELASLGASVLHPRAVEIAAKTNLKLVVSSSRAKNLGTIIREGKKMERALVKAVTSDVHIGLLTMMDVPRSPGSMSQIVTTLTDNGVHLKFFFHGAGRERCDLSFIVADEDIKTCDEILSAISRRLGGKGLTRRDDVASVSIVGPGVGSSNDTLTKMFDCLETEGAHVEAVSTSELKVTCVIGQDVVDKAVNGMARVFKLLDKDSQKSSSPSKKRR